MAKPLDDETLSHISYMLGLELAAECERHNIEFDYSIPVRIFEYCLQKAKEVQIDNEATGTGSENPS